MGLDFRDFFRGKGDFLFLTLGCYQMWSMLKRWLVNGPWNSVLGAPFDGYVLSQVTEALAALAVGLAVLVAAKVCGGGTGARMPDVPWPVMLALGALPAVSDVLGASGSREATLAVIAVCSLVQVWCYTACVCLYSRLDTRRAVFYVLLSYAVSAALRFPFELLPTVVVDVVFAPMPMVCCLMCRRAHAMLDAPRGEGAAPEAPATRNGLLAGRPAQRSWPTYILIVVAFGFAVGTCCRSVETSRFDGTTMFLMYCIQVLLPVAVLLILLGTHESVRVVYVCQLMFTLILATVILLSVGDSIAGHSLEVASYLSRYFVRMFFIVTVTMLIISDRKKRPAVFFCLSYALLYASVAVGNILGQAAALAPGSTSTLYLVVAFLLSVVMVLISSFDMLHRDDPLLFVAPAATDESLSREAEIEKRCAELAAEHRLTTREETVAELICLGRSKRYIAEHLIISENTVRGYAKQLYRKLGIHSKEELEGLVLGTDVAEAPAPGPAR